MSDERHLEQVSELFSPEPVTQEEELQGRTPETAESVPALQKQEFDPHTTYGVGEFPHGPGETSDSAIDGDSDSSRPAYDDCPDTATEDERVMSLVELRDSDTDGIDENREGFTEQEKEEMNQLIDSTMPTFEVGEIIKGRVLKVSSEDVVVDIGSKSEGIVPLKEFLQDGKDQNVFIGMEVDVMVVQRENQEGHPVLSRLKAKERRAKAVTRQAFEKGEPVECVVQEILKGGFQVDVDGLRGFIPFSQMGPHSRTPEQQQALLGQRIKAKIIEMRGRRDLVLSQRAFLEEERKRLREDTMNRVREGSWIKGRVKNLTDFGAFVDLGGIDGLLHINDMSWSHVAHPGDVVKVGQEVDVTVLKVDGERISLGMKQSKSDPWLSVANHYPPGCKVTGKVTSLAKYGAFVELEEGVEGLVHISEISWTRRLRHPSEELKVGDEVRVKVLAIDAEHRRISLSIRGAMTDPWTIAKANYPVGSVIKGQVTGLTDFGAFVRLPEGVDGMIHVSDLSWTEKVKHPKQLLKKGMEVTCKVLDIDPEQQRISLGLKQLEQDPWDVARESYRVGDVVDVTVVKLTEFGAFVELASGVEGLAHASTLLKGDEAPKVGDRVKMKITKFDRHNKKISLSMKEYQREQEHREVEQYLSNSTESLNSLGALIHEALQSRQAEEAAKNRNGNAGETETPPEESQEDNREG
ncbi:MAG TPA: 30S ribosomal protein S1 [bacterium]|nr:30S ribosomal protein S1 [bacterium]HQL62686.1 30S ribosomal protein S1 [bacterium]